MKGKPKEEYKDSAKQSWFIEKINMIEKLT
jgi:hypothetical protein